MTLLMPMKRRSCSSLSIFSAVAPPQMMCGTVSTSYSAIIAPHTATSLTRFLTRCFEYVPSGFPRYSYSSLWQVTLMYFGLNSMKGLIDSISSCLVSPFSGGTISNEGKACPPFASISLIFIFVAIFMLLFEQMPQETACFLGSHAAACGIIVNLSA